MWKLLRPDAIEVLDELVLKRSSARYFAVTQNEKPAKFKIAQKIPANFVVNDPLERLWEENERLRREFSRIEQEIASIASLDCVNSREKSFFEMKLEIAGRILNNFHFCSRKCKTNRALGELG